MPERLTPRAASEQAKAEARRRLREARDLADLPLRGLARAMADHGHQVGYAHLARVESGDRRITRDLLIAWGKATRQADPQAWAEEIVTILGREQLGRPRRVLQMQFRPPPPAEVPEILKGSGLPSRLSSPEALYARVVGLLGQVPKGPRDDADPVVITTRGPLADAFREVAQSIAPGPIVRGVTEAYKLVQLAAVRRPEEHVQAVEEVLAASSVLPPGDQSAHQAGEALEARDVYEPLVTTSGHEFDIIAIPGVGGAVVLSHPGGGCLWLSVPPEDYPHLCEYLDPALREARSRPVIELMRAGTLMTRYWFRGWESKLLEHEKDAEERLFLQPHLGLHTLPPDLATRKGQQEILTQARRHRERDTESWLALRAERIAVFRRKLRRGECRYRDIVSYDNLRAMAADGYTHLHGIVPPPEDDPKARRERLLLVREHLTHLRDLLVSEPDGYQLRFLPDDKVPRNRQWSLVRKPGHGVDVVLAFTLIDQARQRENQQPHGDQGPWFANAVVNDEEVSRGFREEFEQLWSEAPGRDHTLEVLAESIDATSAATADRSR